MNNALAYQSRQSEHIFYFFFAFLILYFLLSYYLERKQKCYEKFCVCETEEQTHKSKLRNLYNLQCKIILYCQLRNSNIQYTILKGKCIIYAIYIYICITHLMTKSTYIHIHKFINVLCMCSFDICIYSCIHTQIHIPKCVYAYIAFIYISMQKIYDIAQKK